MKSRIHVTAIIAAFSIAVGLALTGCAGSSTRDSTADSDKPYSVAEDTELANKVRREIYKDAMLADTRINVRVEAKVATITGTVPSRMEADRIERILKRIEELRGYKMQVSERR